MSLKNTMTPAGIEPATFRFVAQHVNHCATAVPRSCRVKYENLWSEGGGAGLTVPTIAAMFRYVCFGVSLSYTVNIIQFIYANVTLAKTHGRMSNIHQGHSQ